MREWKGGWMGIFKQFLKDFKQFLNPYFVLKNASALESFESPVVSPRTMHRSAGDPGLVINTNTKINEKDLIQNLNNFMTWYR